MQYNEIYNNGYYNFSSNSGIKISMVTPPDSSSLYQNFINGNKIYFHRRLKSDVKIEDDCALKGNGSGIFIRKSNNSRSGMNATENKSRVLISNNLIYANGGIGINLYNSKNIDVFNNTMYENNEANSFDCADLNIRFASFINVYNNIIISRDNRKASFYINAQDIFFSNNLYRSGTKFENGKVVITNGYKAVQSSDKTMVFILADNGNNVEGSFSCKCFLGLGACGVIISGSAVGCSGAECCRFKVTTGNLSGLTMQDIERAPEKLKWKNLVLPVKSN